MRQISRDRNRGSMTETSIPSHSNGLPRAHWWALATIAAAVTLLHLLTNGRYGFHRDEWQFLSDARHLDWGFVAYPPLTAAVERLSLAVFGLNMVGLRLASVLAQAMAIVVTGLMARELGGRRLAQVTAAVTVALSPLPLFEGTEFQYTTFDYLWWVLIAFFTIRLLRTGDARWWVAIGAAIGMGLETKYAISFFVAALLAGLLFSSARRYFLNPWFYGGVAVALMISLPNLVWLARHNFISYTFLQYIHARDVGQGRSDGFLLDQIKVCINVFAVPIVIAGLVAFLRSPRYRMVGVMFLTAVALFYFAKGRGYYTAGAYPMVLAMGAVAGEGWLARLSAWPRRSLEIVYFAGLASIGAYAIAIVVPVASSGSLRDFALAHNGDLREEIGWEQMTKTVAAIRDSLPADQRASVGITDGNYGEHGAIELLGPAYGLPAPIGTTNSAWLRGYPTPPPGTFIVLGLSREKADSIFTRCRLARHNGNSEGVSNEESEEHPDIFVCGPPRLAWPELWNGAQTFG